MSIRRLSALLVVALLTFAGFAGSSGAATMRFEPGGAVAIAGTFTGELEGVQVTCNVTLNGTLTSTLVPVARESRIGSITESRAEGCNLGVTLRILTPRAVVNPVILIIEPEVVTGVLAKIENFGILISELFGRACLYGGEIGVLIGSESRATVVQVLNETALLRVTTLGGLCPASMPWSASLRISPTQRVIRGP